MMMFMFTISMSTILFMILLDKKNHLPMKKLGLISSFITLWVSVMLWIMQELKSTFQFSFYLKWMTENSYANWGLINFGIDEMSLPFLMLTNLLIPICMMMSWNTIKFLMKEFMLALLFMQLLLTIVFTSLNMLVFYMSFEGMLMPMFLIMGIWGSSKEKESAAYYFFFFTLVGSLFMLLGLFTLYNYPRVCVYIGVYLLVDSVFCKPSSVSGWKVAYCLCSKYVLVPMKLYMCVYWCMCFGSYVGSYVYIML